MELSFTKIRDVGKVAIFAGLGQVVLTALGGFALSHLLGFGLVESLFLAAALTFSSTVVVVKLLDEKEETDHLHGRISMGILLMQDLVVIVVLTCLAGLGGAGGEFDVGDLLSGLGRAFGGMILLSGFALAASRWILPKPFHWAARSPEMILVWALSWCFLLVWMAHAFGLSLEVGAFLAGLSLAQLPYNSDLRRRVHPLMNLFIAVFFVSLGIGMDPGGTGRHGWSILIFTGFVLLIGPLILMPIICRLGFGMQTSFRVGVTLAQVSEFSFILVGMGVARGLIGGEILSITAMTGIATIAISSYMILYDGKLWRYLAVLFRLKDASSRNGQSSTQDPPDTSEISNHVIVVGMNTLGREIVRKLHAKGEVVLAVDVDPAKLRGLPGHKLLGSVEYLSVLRRAGLDRARLLVSALQIENTNELLAYRCQAAGIPSAVHVVDMSVADALLDLGVDYLMVPKVDGVKAQLEKLRAMEVLQP
jgi:Kef-type K+ transport system membrane component KefB